MGCSDSKNHILAVHVSNARTGENAKIVLKKTREVAKENPRVIITDGLQGYKKACKIFGRKTKHVVAHFEKKFIYVEGKIEGFSNNRIERINGDIDLFFHVFIGLKGFMNVQNGLIYSGFGLITASQEKKELKLILIRFQK